MNLFSLRYQIVFFENIETIKKGKLCKIILQNTNYSTVTEDKNRLLSHNFLKVYRFSSKFSKK